MAAPPGLVSTAAAAAGAAAGSAGATPDKARHSHNNRHPCCLLPSGPHTARAGELDEDGLRPHVARRPRAGAHCAQVRPPARVCARGRGGEGEGEKACVCMRVCMCVLMWVGVGVTFMCAALAQQEPRLRAGPGPRALVHLRHHGRAGAGDYHDLPDALPRHALGAEDRCLCPLAASRRPAQRVHHRHKRRTASATPSRCCNRWPPTTTRARPFSTVPDPPCWSALRGAAPHPL